ncbi:MAG: hypothetical protein GXP48_06680, partial [Acidobacteria bacterium]|nr:hypothetical protein [Acidobacteriota bacterium]
MKRMVELWQRKAWWLEMTARMGRVRRGALVAVALAMVFSSVGFAEKAGPAPERFPVLRSLAGRGQEAVTLSAEAKASLLRETAVERALWEDDLKRLEERATSSGVSGSGEALARIGAVRSEVMGKLKALETSIGRGKLEPDVVKSVLSLGPGEAKRPRWPVISGGGLRIAAPVHREVSLRGGEAAYPEGYWEAPGGGVRAQSVGPGEVEEAAAVQAKAKELGYDPVAAYRYVLGSIRPVAGYGLARKPEATLQSGEGTGADQAALLAALLRASGYPARLVWGVQEIGRQALEGQLGVADGQLEAALTEGGYAWTPVVSGGSAVAYRVSRIWCEAWIPFVNFRGVVLDRSGSTWVALDPWMKEMAGWPGGRVLEAMGLDGSELRGRYLAGEFCGDDLSKAGACPGFREVLRSEVNQYLQSAGETVAYADLAGGREQEASREALLPSSMVGRIVQVDGFGLALPEGLQYRVRIRGVIGSQVVLDADLDVAAISGGEAVVWYEPAAQADQDVVDALGGYLWDVPPYLVNVAPVVMVGQQVIARGEAGIGMGRPWELQVELTAPSGAAVSFSNAALAGVPVGLGMAVGKQGYEPPDGDPASTIELLSKLASGYLDGVAGFGEEAAALDHLAVVHEVPSVVMVSSVIDPEGSVGEVTNLDWLGMQVDADVWGSEPVGQDAAARGRWRELTRLNASTAERGLFEGYGITSVSADLALILARRGGTQVLHIDSSNLAASLAELPYDSAIESEIEAWVDSGGEADVPVQPLGLLQWTGVGYVLTDPETGEAKYQLAGGLSGGMT